MAISRLSDLFSRLARYLRRKSRSGGLSYEIGRNSLLGVRRELAAGADPNVLDSDGDTALRKAVLCASPEVVSLLLKSGADPNAPSADGRSFVHDMVQSSRLSEVIEVAFSAGADPDVRDAEGATPLHLLAGDNWPEVALGEALLHGGADPLARDNSGRTPISLAVEMANGELLALLCRACAEVDLLVASGAGDARAVRALLAEGGGVGLEHCGDVAPLHAACAGGHRDVVARLLEAGADANVVTSNGSTPLELAARAGHKSMREVEDDPREIGRARPYVSSLQTLLEHGVRSGMEQALYIAAWAGGIETVRLLLAHGADPNSGDTAALSIASDGGHIQVVRELLDRGADANARAKDGDTALYAAAYAGQDHVVRELLQRGADPDVLNREWGYYPIHAAIYECYGSVLGELLEAGARVDVKDLTGATPLRAARQLHPAAVGKSQMIEQLRRHGARL